MDSYKNLHIKVNKVLTLIVCPVATAVLNSAVIWRDVNLGINKDKIHFTFFITASTLQKLSQPKETSVQPVQDTIMIITCWLFLITYHQALFVYSIFISLGKPSDPGYDV